MDKIRLISLSFAAALMALTCAVHVLLGGPEINRVVQASDLSAEVRSTSAVVWHMITALLAFFAIATVYLVRRFNVALSLAVIGLEAIFAILFIAISLSAYSSAVTLPQWTAFALAAVLTLPALRNIKP